MTFGIPATPSSMVRMPPTTSAVRVPESAVNADAATTYSSVISVGAPPLVRACRTRSFASPATSASNESAALACTSGVTASFCAVTRDSGRPLAASLTWVSSSFSGNPSAMAPIR